MRRIACRETKLGRIGVAWAALTLILLIGCAETPNPVSVGPDGRLFTALGDSGRYQGFISGNTIIAQLEPDGSGFRGLTDGLEHCAWPAVSPDGRRVAYIAEQTRLQLVDVDGDRPPQQLLDSDIPLHQPVWSADGRTLAVLAADSILHSGDLLIVAAADGRVLAQIPDAVPGHGLLPDGEFGVVVAPTGIDPETGLVEGQLWSITPDGRERYPRWDSTFLQFNAWSARPDGRELFAAVPYQATGSPDWDLVIVRHHLATGVTMTIADQPGAMFFPALSPDGSRLLFTLAERGEDALAGRLMVYRVDDRRVEEVVALPEAEVSFPFWIDEDRIGFSYNGMLFAVDLGRDADPIPLTAP